MIRLDSNPNNISVRRLVALGLCLGVLSHGSMALAGRFKPKSGIGRANQRIGLASRGGCAVAPDSKPLTALVPLSSGFTATPKPNLIWFMPQHTFPSVEVRLFESSDSGLQIVHQTALENLPKNQLVGYDLAAEEIEPLEAGKAYKWQVHLVCDPDSPSGNIFAEGWIEYEAPAVALSQQLEAASASQKADLWLENGYWYEGVQALWQQMKTQPSARQSWQELMSEELVDLPHLASVAGINLENATAENISVD